MPKLAGVLATTHASATVLKVALVVGLVAVNHDVFPSLLFFIEVVEVSTMLIWYISVAVSRFKGYSIAAVSTQDSSRMGSRITMGLRGDAVTIFKRAVARARVRSCFASRRAMVATWFTLAASTASSSASTAATSLAAASSPPPRSVRR